MNEASSSGELHSSSMQSTHPVGKAEGLKLETIDKHLISDIGQKQEP